MAWYDLPVREETEIARGEDSLPLLWSMLKGIVVQSSLLKQTLTATVPEMQAPTPDSLPPFESRSPRKEVYSPPSCPFRV